MRQSGQMKVRPEVGGGKMSDEKYLRTFVCVKDRAAFCYDLKHAAHEPRLRKIEVEPWSFAPPSQLSY